ncbi:phosphatase PAP2 family protein [Nisaea acidiphila]|uniref:Phosphatase PAP2 family protein n=1 Tax=Nisaea acidiphila TaxID=1862145 RepID=A0A9J7ATZ0_9PROT|nr:phosphatase PAP2 family protein [Nisaea acidiphila]UUX50824.1 phosphatase PAP2 family protein [Nisaea acidiphila]
MKRWSPRVRGLILDFELLENLEFFANRRGEPGEACDPGVKIRIANSREEGSVPDKKGQLVKLERPSVNTFLNCQLEYVHNYADLRRDRAAEILSQVDGFLEFFAGIGFLHPERTRWTLELLGALLSACFAIEMRIKHSLACRRPVELSAQINPMLQTPGHGTFPSGHATEAFMVAYVLAELTKAMDEQLSKQIAETDGEEEEASFRPKRIWRQQLLRQAARISVNRVIAGVHYPVDSAAGQVLGKRIADYFLLRARGGTAEFESWKFVGDCFGSMDFDWRDIDRILTGTACQTPFLNIRGKCVIHGRSPGPNDPAGPLNWLWEKACSEWAI